jgi:hypothetical protein
MSLDKKPKGNPNWGPGKSGNPDGRPKGAKSLKSLLKVAPKLSEKNRHPVDELIRLADKAEQAASQVIITNPGATSWKVGEIVDRNEVLAMNAQIKDGRLVEAKVIPGGDTELAAKIWTDLLQYCEPKKKAVESAPEKPVSPDESVENAGKLLEEMERIANGNPGTNPSAESSNKTSLDNGTPEVSPKAGPTPDLRPDQGQH